MSREIFLNFPIQLLQGAPDMRKVGNDIMDYAIYKHAQTLNGSIYERMKAAAEYFKINLGSITGAANNGEQLHDSIPARSPMTGINKKLMFDFYEGNQTDFEIAVLMAHLAIKSIMGSKSYSRVTNEHLVSRMAGYASVKDMTGLPEYLKPYTTRRRMNNIKSELQKSYNLKIYGRYTQGFFVSEKLSLEELIKEVEMKRKKWYQQQHKAELSRAVSKVLNELYDGKN